MLQGRGRVGGRLAPEADTYNYAETGGPNRRVADMWMFTPKSCCQSGQTTRVRISRRELAASVTRKQIQFHAHWLIRRATQPISRIYSHDQLVKVGTERCSPERDVSSRTSPLAVEALVPRRRSLVSVAVLDLSANVKGKSGVRSFPSCASASEEGPSCSTS